MKDQISKYHFLPKDQISIDQNYISQDQMSKDIERSEGEVIRLIFEIITIIYD